MVRIALRKIPHLLLAGILLPLMSAPAAAQAARCAPRADMVAALGETYNENQQAYGLLGPQLILEVFVSEKGGWTIIITGADGISCILAAGLGWENLPQPVVEGEATGAGSGG